MTDNYVFVRLIPVITADSKFRWCNGLGWWTLGKQQVILGIVFQSSMLNQRVVEIYY